MAQMILIEEVTKEYDQLGRQQGPLIAADRLSLEVPEGEVFGLIGPNGAGKTTTLKMLCGLLTPTSGKIIVNGVNVELQPDEAQKHIGYLADFFSVYGNLKVWEYVDHFARAYKLDRGSLDTRVRQAIAQVGLETKADSFVEELSRGMKQRLGIARAIVHDPAVLILDEPASGLDPKARVELKELLRQLNRQGKTIFITSHVLSDLQEICTAVGVMEKGKLLKAGKIEEVMRSAGTARRVHLRLASSGFELSRWLEGRGIISNPPSNPLSADFPFSGTDEDLASLIKNLVQAGAPICSIEEKMDSLETIFSKLSSGEVM
jgi:ABC-2 type transport system ATP-binding protein